MEEHLDILHFQRRGIIKMLYQTEKHWEEEMEHNDNEDDSHASWKNKKQKQTKSKKTKKKKKSMTAESSHVQSGSDLGMILTERNVQRWKVFIYDQFTQNLISQLFNVGDLRSFGVTLLMDIKDKRHPIPDAPAIYFVQPTRENVDLICRDCADDLYDTVFLNFSSAMSRELLEHMATQIMESESTNKIAKVHDQFMNYACLERKFFSLEIPRSMTAIHDPTEERSFAAHLDQVANGIVSAVLTMKTIPLVAFPTQNATSPTSPTSSSSSASSGHPAEILSRKVEQKLRSFYFNKSNQFHFTERKPSGGSGASRPVLLIVDRSVDYNACLQHQWSYRGLMHDVFQMKYNRVSVPTATSSSNNSGSSSGKAVVNYKIDFDDEFWQENAPAPFQEVADHIRDSLQTYKKELSDFNRKTGLSINEEELLSGDGMEKVVEDQKDSGGKSASGNNTSMSRQMVDEVFQLSGNRKRVDMHTTIAHAILNEIKRRKLDEFVVIEEKLIEQASLDRKDTETVRSLFSNSTIPSDASLEERKTMFEDQLRLFLICYLTCWPALERKKKNRDSSRAKLKETAASLFSSPLTEDDLQAFEDHLRKLRKSIKDNESDHDANSDTTDTDAAALTASTHEVLPELTTIKSLLRQSSAASGMALPERTQDSLSRITKSMRQSMNIFGEQLKLITGINTQGGEGASIMPLTKMVHTLATGSRDELHENFIFLDPKISTGAGGGPFQINVGRVGVQEVIAFMLGGGNYAEYQNLLDHFVRLSATGAATLQPNKFKNVTYGCTSLVHPQEFLQELSNVGAKLRS